MRDELVAFLKRAADAGDVAIDLCDTGPMAGIVRSFEPSEIGSFETCADAILDAAKGDAVGRNGKVRYEVTGVREGKRWGRHPIVIDTGGVPGGGSFGVEDANLAGILVEMIRDKREIMRMAIGSNDNVMARMQSMLDLQAKQLIEIENSRVRIFEVIEDLTQHRHERDIAAKKMETEARASDRMVEEFVPMISVIGNKLLGKATGDPAPLGSEMIGGLLGSLDEKQIQAIMATLSPMQAAAFISFMQATAEAKEKKETEEKKAYDARTNGAVNAEGGVG